MAGLEIFESEYAIEQPESRGYTGDSWQFIFKVYKDHVKELIPDNSLYLPEYGYHDKSRLLVTNGAIWATVTLTFIESVDSAPGSLANRQEQVPEWSRHSSLMEIPLSDLGNYLVNWEYDLYQAKDKSATSFTSTIPDWWNTATDKTDTTIFNPSNNNYRWARTQPADFNWSDTQKYTWIKIKDRTKPGIETKELSVFTVTAKMPFKKKEDAINYSLKEPDILIAPDETFGLIPATTNYWKYNPMEGPYQEGDWWIVEQQWKWNKYGWDTDIYKGVST
jgi:hypothetical protein